MLAWSIEPVSWQLGLHGETLPWKKTTKFEVIPYLLSVLKMSSSEPILFVPPDYEKLQRNSSSYQKTISCNLLFSGSPIVPAISETTSPSSPLLNPFNPIHQHLNIFFFFMMVHIFNLSTGEAEAGRCQWVQRQPGLYRELQTTLKDLVSKGQKSKNKTKQKLSHLGLLCSYLGGRNKKMKFLAS